MFRGGQKDIGKPSEFGEQKQSLIYGPVSSRRFGTTIGISLIPLKVCSFDCVFCELSVHTNVLTLERHTYVSVNEVLKELRNFPTQGVDYIALSGAGEPTLAATWAKSLMLFTKSTQCQSWF